MGFLDSGMVVVLIITAVLLFVTALLLFYNFEVALSLSIKPTSWVWSISLTFELTFVKMQSRHNFAMFFYLPLSKQITLLCLVLYVNHLLLTFRVIATPIPPRWDGFKMKRAKLWKTNTCGQFQEKYMWTIPRKIHVDNSKTNTCGQFQDKYMWTIPRQTHAEN